MKRRTAQFILLALLTGGGQFFLYAGEHEVLSAKNNMASALTKLGLLTDSLSEQEKQNPSLAGMMIANHFTSKIDSLIIHELQKNMSCADIQKEVDQVIDGTFGNFNESLSIAADKARKNTVIAMKNYSLVQCANLTE